MENLIRINGIILTKAKGLHQTHHTIKKEFHKEFWERKNSWKSFAPFGPFVSRKRYELQQICSNTTDKNFMRNGKEIM